MKMFGRRRQSTPQTRDQYESYVDTDSASTLLCESETYAKERDLIISILRFTLVVTLINTLCVVYVYSGINTLKHIIGKAVQPSI